MSNRGFGLSSIKKVEKLYLENFFNALNVLPINSEIIQKTIALKQKRNIPTPDAIVAATAIVKNIPLLTQNKKDFVKIEALTVLSIEDLRS